MQRRKPRRYSRFRKMGPQPRFQIGDQAGEFNIIEYLGYQRTAPTGEPRVLSQEHHWYKVRCSCVNRTEEVHTQQQLIDVRRLRSCTECQSNINQLKESL